METKIEECEEIKNNIKKYISSSKKYKISKELIEIDLIKIGGYSNFNYRGIIKNISTNEIIEQIFYRKYGSKFGALTESVNHDIESLITEYLAKKGYGPKLLFKIENDCSISEFLIDTITLPIEKCFDKDIIEQLCNILNYFTLMSYSYKFTIDGDNLSLIPIEDVNNGKKINVMKNHYEKYVVSIYEKTKTSFKVFSDKFIQKYSKEKNPLEWADFELVKNYLYNFPNLFKENFNNKGFLVLNHNDVFRFNILLREKEQKIFLIDHEYFSLNLPGYDLAYYLVEYYIQYEPEYNMALKSVDFDKMFVIYETFINKFIQEHKYFEKEEGGKDFIEIIKRKSYFIKLINIINLSLFVWSIGNVKFEDWDKKQKNEFFFIHGTDRIKFYLAGINALSQ